MKILVVLCALFALATCNTCGPLQRLKVKQQWATAFGTAHSRIDFGTAIWRGVFRQAPQAKELFKRVHPEDITGGMFVSHSQRVLGMLNNLFSTLDNEELLNLSLSHVRDDHKEMNTPKNGFQIFKNALMKVVPAAMGRCFDEDAWNACFDVIIAGITDY